MSPITLGGQAAPTRPATERLQLTPAQQAEAAYMVVGNAWLDCSFLASEIAALDAKRVKLATLLDDPSLVDDFPADAPERREAEAKHTHLSLKRRRLLDELHDAAKRLARLWGKLPPHDKNAFVQTIGEGWGDVPLVELGRMDPAINLRPVFRALYAAWGEPARKGLGDEPPF